MSQENVEVVQRIVRRMVDQDIDAALADIDAEAMLDWSNSEAPDSGVYTGHAAWRAFMQMRNEAFAQKRVDSVEILVPAADTVVLVGRFRERGGRAASRWRLAAPPY